MGLTRTHALTAGALLGLVLALASVLRLGPELAGPPSGAVALVGQTPISEGALARASHALMADTNLAPAQARERALQRLIDEELAVQRGIEMGVAVDDPRVRALLVEAVIDSVTAPALDAVPTEAELVAVHAHEPGRYSASRRVRVAHALFTGADARHRAEAARAEVLAGGKLVGDGVATVPDLLLPLSKLRDYVGDSPARAAATLLPGEARVVETEAGAHVVAVLEAVGGEPQPLSVVRDAVEAQWRRERADQALEVFFVEMRRRVRVVQ